MKTQSFSTFGRYGKEKVYTYKWFTTFYLPYETNIRWTIHVKEVINGTQPSKTQDYKQSNQQCWKSTTYVTSHYMVNSFKTKTEWGKWVVIKEMNGLMHCMIILIALLGSGNCS